MTEKKTPMDLTNALTIAKPKKVGRPSTCTPEVTEPILNAIVHGESIRDAVRAQDKVPYGTVMRWLYGDIGRDTSDYRYEFRRQFRDAMIQRAHGMVDDMLGIADGGSTDVQRDRLSFQARQWLAGKMIPDLYGDKTVIEGGDADKPVRTLADTSDEELARRVALMLSLMDPE